MQTSCCKWEPSMHVQWLSGFRAPVKSVASSRPKVDTPVLLLIRCRCASHARKQLSIWGDFSLQRRRASESTLIWACLRVRHHAIVCGHKQRDCPISGFLRGRCGSAAIEHGIDHGRRPGSNFSHRRQAGVLLTHGGGRAAAAAVRAAVARRCRPLPPAAAPSTSAVWPSPTRTAATDIDAADLGSRAQVCSE